MVDNLERFLSEAVGQSYGLGGILKQKTMRPGKESDRLIQEDRSFFCSELVAKAFKLLGVIEDDETSCTQFWPHHFSSKGDKFLKLTEGTTIEGEMQIVTDESFLNDTSVEIIPDDE